VVRHLEGLEGRGIVSVVGSGKGEGFWEKSE
jgi:hypothetical protein